MIKNKKNKMEYINFYYEDFQEEKLNLTDRIILSTIASIGEYKVDKKELSKINSVCLRSIKESIDKLKDKNFINGDKILKCATTPSGKYYRVDLNNNFHIKERLVIGCINNTTYKSFYGSLDTLSKIIGLSVPSLSNLLKSMVKKEILLKNKKGKCFEYKLNKDYQTDDIVELPNEEIVENVEVEPKEIITTPTIDNEEIERLNERLNKAGEVIKQQQQQIDKLLKLVEELKNSMINQSEKISKLYKVNEPILDFVHEVNADVSTLFQEIGKERKKCESECDIKDIRKIFDKL